MALEAPRSRRADVRDAALTLFAERGYHGTSMKDIAEAVGMRAPSLYNHVGAKQELLMEIVEATLVDLQRRHEAAVGSTGDVAQALRRAVELDVRQSVFDLSTTFAVLELQRMAVQQARQLLVGETRRFEAGESQLLTVNLRERLLLPVHVRVRYAADGPAPTEQMPAPGNGAGSYAPGATRY